MEKIGRELGAASLPALMRLPEVAVVTHRSKGSIYRGVREGTFPRPVRIGGAKGRAVAWKVEAIQGWLNALKVAE
ncbi:helix-turn-helix transcriptional regulator [Caballeronia telluris]|uniref:helix-turn-helix transcriptional regulator n=1 Tax=Caballeronia telluris TaxID=326475 RepID=UPI000B3EA363|nr:AlpA family phage regulatory protein [Caballeronia telluris]